MKIILSLSYLHPPTLLKSIIFYLYLSYPASADPVKTNYFLSLSVISYIRPPCQNVLFSISLGPIVHPTTLSKRIIFFLSRSYRASANPVKMHYFLSLSVLSYIRPPCQNALFYFSLGPIVHPPTLSKGIIFFLSWSYRTSTHPVKTHYFLSLSALSYILMRLINGLL